MNITRVLKWLSPQANAIRGRGEKNKSEEIKRSNQNSSIGMKFFLLQVSRRRLREAEDQMLGKTHARTSLY